MGRHVVILKNDVMKVEAELEKRTGTAVKKIGSDAEASMKSEAPVATGNLRNNTGFESTGDAKGDLFSNAEYARYVNDGTYKMPARPFFTHGVEQAKRDLAESAKHIFDGLP